MFLSPWHKSPQRTRSSSLSRLQYHTQTHYSQKDSSDWVISPTQRALLDNIQHSQETAIHVPGGIRTYNPNRRAAAGSRLRPCGHWNRLCAYCSLQNMSMLSILISGLVFLLFLQKTPQKLLGTDQIAVHTIKY